MRATRRPAFPSPTTVRSLQQAKPIRSSFTAAVFSLSALSCGPGPVVPVEHGSCSATHGGVPVFDQPVVSDAPRQPTLFQVDWSTRWPLESWIEIGSEDQQDWRVPSGGEVVVQHSQQLRGLRAATDYHFRLVASDGQRTFCSEPQPLLTLPFPSGVPDITVELLDETRAAPGYLVTSLFPDPLTMVSVVVDSAGQLVWLQPEGNGMVTRQDVNGTGLLVHRQATAADEPGRVVAVSYAGADTGSWVADGGHRDFAVVEPQRVATYTWQLRGFEDDSRWIVADDLVEIGPDGEVELIWSPFDGLELDLEQTYREGAYPGDPNVEDWTHSNSLDFDPDEQAYYLLASDPEEVYKIDRATGELRWVLGPDGGDFALEGDGPIIDFPHSVQRVEGGLLIFNRSAEGCSEAVEIALDEQAMTAAVVWRHAADECFEVYWMGQAERLSNGNTRIAWATAGYLDEVTPDGEIVRRYRLPLGAGFGFGEQVESLYPGF